MKREPHCIIYKLQILYYNIRTICLRNSILSLYSNAHTSILAYRTINHTDTNLYIVGRFFKTNICLDVEREKT